MRNRSPRLGFKMIILTVNRICLFKDRVESFLVASLEWLSAIPLSLSDHFINLIRGY